jgi:outer membrane protein assembly factor BamA
MGSIAYDRVNTQQIKFKFNLRTDADILAHLAKQENKQLYIKQLIRADIARQTQPKEQPDE